jgi:hypothetical protein
MSTVTASEVLAARVAQLKQTQGEIAAAAQVYIPETQPIIIKPSMPSWEDLQAKLAYVINLPGLWITIRQLYEQGYGAELETAAEIALATAKKSPFHLFATMTSKKAGKWATITLTMVHETWQVRRNALHVIERLKLRVDSLKAILALSWRLRDSIMRYLGLATEQGIGIKNPIGLFFALTKRPAPPA